MIGLIGNVISNVADAVLGHHGASPAAGKPAAGTADFSSILDAFNQEASKTPMQRARDQVLKAHGMTEDQYNQLPDQAKTAIDREIAAAVQRAAQQQAQAATIRNGRVPDSSGLI